MVRPFPAVRPAFKMLRTHFGLRLIAAGAELSDFRPYRTRNFANIQTAVIFTTYEPSTPVH